MFKRVYEQKLISPQDFDTTIKKLRAFFTPNGYVEAYHQSQLSIMAACEDPKTVRSFTFGGQLFPLPQTGQMWLEYFLLSNPDINGVYCTTTSFRDEPNPIEGRHDKIFPMFEFEREGAYLDLIDTLSKLAIHLGFADSVDNIPIFTYDDLCTKYNTNHLEADHELQMWYDYGDVVGITNFPERTSPFWNMQQEGVNSSTGERLFNKCDFIICGIETFGAAARSSDPKQMRDSFHSISDGMYAKLLYNQFDQERVEQELEDYLALPMRNRFGAGIGVTRLMRALKLKNLI